METKLHLSSIHPSMAIYEQEFYDKLVEDVKLNGFTNPLVVVPMTVGKWNMYCNDNEYMLPPPEGLEEDTVILQVRCGNNRYWAAKELGINIVPVLKCGNMRESNQACKKQQRYTEWQN